MSGLASAHLCLRVCSPGVCLRRRGRIPLSVCCLLASPWPALRQRVAHGRGLPHTRAWLSSRSWAWSWSRPSLRARRAFRAPSRAPAGTLLAPVVLSPLPVRPARPRLPLRVPPPGTQRRTMWACVAGASSCWWCWASVVRIRRSTSDRRSACRNSSRPRRDGRTPCRAARRRPHSVGAGTRNTWCGSPVDVSVSCRRSL